MGKRNDVAVTQLGLVPDTVIHHVKPLCQCHTTPPIFSCEQDTEIPYEQIYSMNNIWYEQIYRTRDSQYRINNVLYKQMYSRNKNPFHEVVHLLSFNGNSCSTS
jgi:hypothetical protein